MQDSNASRLADWTHTLLSVIKPATTNPALKIGPPMVARALAMVYTAAFQAWSVYDSKARAPLSGGHSKMPFDQSQAEMAVSFAIYRTAENLFPDAEVIQTLREKMADLQYDPALTEVTGNTPVAVGNQAAALVIASRLHDGANQSGLEPGSPTPPAGQAPVPYADTTHYAPAQGLVVMNDPTRRDQIANPGRWEPLRITPAEPAQTYLAPHWGKVQPFAMAGGYQFRPPPPAEAWTQRFLEQARHVVEVQSQLTTEQKIIAEYWADGPNSITPPGHWCEIAAKVSEKSRHTLETDAKMFFALANALLDASIATWEAKRHYDYCRPVTAIRWLFDGIPIQSWEGESGKIISRDGALWRPFQKITAPTPPFPEYTSGHSAFSMAAATVLKTFLGDDKFVIEHIQCVPLEVEPCLNVQGHRLTWNSFTSAAYSAGESRIFGGIHFYEGNISGLEVGRKVGIAALNKAQQYF